MSEEERQFRRGYRQGFYAAVKAYDKLLTEHKVPQERLSEFLNMFAQDGNLFQWMQRGAEGSAENPPDALKEYLSRLGRHVSYSS